MVDVTEHIRQARKAYGHMKGRDDLECLCLTIERLLFNLKHERRINEMHKSRTLVMERALQDKDVDLRKLQWNK